MKKSHNLQLFHDTVDQVKKYLLVLNPDLIDYKKEEYELDGNCDVDVDYAEELEERKKFRYHDMVVEYMHSEKFREDLFDGYKIRYVKSQLTDNGDSDEVIIQIQNRYFCVEQDGYREIFYWDTLHEVMPQKTIIYVPIDK